MQKSLPIQQHPSRYVLDDTLERHGRYLPNAYSRPTVEWNIRPGLRRPIVPSFRGKLKVMWEVRRLVRVDIGPSLHHKRGVADWRVCS